MEKMNKPLLKVIPAVCNMLRQVPPATVFATALIFSLATIVPAATENKSSANKQLVEEVSTNILKNTRLPYRTQKPLIIVDQEDLTKYSKFEDLLNAELVQQGDRPIEKTNIAQANAFAWDGTAKLLRAAGFTISNTIPDTERVPMMVVTPVMMSKYIKSDANRLALLVGHELSHIIFKHSHKELSSNSFIPYSGFSRAMEEQADHEGLRLALLAKYDQDKMVEFAKDFFSSTEDSAIGFSSHPSDLERLAYLDKKNGKYWQAYHTFVNGVFFLDFEDYATAESEFNKVVNMTKDSYEALNNRGYAKLMNYIDNLETGDLQRLGIGHLLLAGYYRKPTTITPKGVDREIWLSAVKDFEDAEKLNSRSSLIRANLGIAFLVAPDNIPTGNTRTKNFQTAFENFQKAIELMEFDANDDWFKLAVYNNAAVAAIACENKESARLLLSLYEGSIANETVETIAPLAFNKALLAEIRKDYVTAATQLEYFLTNSSDNSKYRLYGKGKYNNDAVLAGKTPLDIPPLVGWSQKRGVYSVNYRGKTVALGTTFDDKTMKDLGCTETAASSPDEIGLVQNYNCPAAGIQIATGGDRKEIILIRLFSVPLAVGAASTINFGEKGMSVLSKVGIGMSKNDFQNIAGFGRMHSSGFTVYGKLNLFVWYETDKVAEILVRPLK